MAIQMNHTGSTVCTLGTDSTSLTIDTPVVSTGDITAFSDARLKTNLERIDNALFKVCTLTGYTYTRTDTGAEQTGLLAQDVQKVLPEAVHTTDTGTLSIAYGNLVGLLVEAVKELKNEVDRLNAK